MEYTKKDIVRILEEYKGNKRVMLQLQYELERRRDIVSADEIIEAMSYHRTGGESVWTGHISDKTARIALCYRDEMDSYNNSFRKELQAELSGVKQEVERLEYYITLLDEKQATVLRMLYLERISGHEVQKRAGISESTLNRHRKAGIDALLTMYNRLTQWKSDNDSKMEEK